MMKIKCFALLVSFITIIGFASSATILNVNNNINSPGGYTTLTEAVTAAQPGDTILIAGSNTNYGSLHITKRLTVMGTGYYPRKDVQLISKVSSITITGGAADNSIIQGLYVQDEVNAIGTLNGLELSRCHLGGFGANSRSLYFLNATNITVYQNLIGYTFRISAGNNIVVTNNIFNYNMDLGTLPNYVTNVIIKNNLFLHSNVAQQSYGILFSNNIFYFRSPSANTSDLFPGSSNSNNVFTNNICFNQKPNPLPIGINNNSGSGNLVANPLFNSINLTGDFHTMIYNEDYRLQAGSPAINFGTDGMDIGVYGSFVAIDYPLAGEPFIPQVKSMTINNNVVLPGGTLNVNIKAKKAN